MATALYPRVVGTAWQEVHEAVRKSHLSAGELRAKGVFHVVHGQSRITRLLAWLLRLPPPAEATPVQLKITSYKQGERWSRTFGRKRVVTFQREVPNGALAERFGFIEFRFRLAVIAGAIHYFQQEAAVCLGTLCLILPPWLAPQVEAKEESVAGMKCTRVWVTVSLLFIGLLIGYEGILEVEGKL